VRGCPRQRRDCRDVARERDLREGDCPDNLGCPVPEHHQLDQLPGSPDTAASDSLASQRVGLPLGGDEPQRLRKPRYPHLQRIALGLEPIERHREQSPGLLVEANLAWTRDLRYGEVVRGHPCVGGRNRAAAPMRRVHAARGSMCFDAIREAL
jgi:hypothetical protein